MLKNVFRMIEAEAEKGPKEREKVKEYLKLLHDWVDMGEQIEVFQREGRQDACEGYIFLQKDWKRRILEMEGEGT